MSPTRTGIVLRLFSRPYSRSFAVICRLRQSLRLIKKFFRQVYKMTLNVHVTQNIWVNLDCLLCYYMSHFHFDFSPFSYSACFVSIKSFKEH